MVSWVLLGINQSTDFWVPNQPTAFWVPIHPQDFWVLINPQTTGSPINPQTSGSPSTHSHLDPHQPTASWIPINPHHLGTLPTHSLLGPHKPTASWVHCTPSGFTSYDVWVQPQLDWSVIWAFVGNLVEIHPCQLCHEWFLLASTEVRKAKEIPPHLFVYLNFCSILIWVLQ